MPDQIANFWDIIKYAVEESLPPIVGDHPDKMNRILASLLCGKTECWASYRKNNDGIIFEGICLTKIIYDDASDTRNLLLYTVYGYEKTIENTWMDAFLSVAKYAKAKKCSQIIAYSAVPYLIEKAKKYGGNTDFTLISFNIQETSNKITNKEIH